MTRVGPDIPLSEAAAALALGVVALLFAGVQPALLGALGEEHRLSAAGLGLTATFEGLAMGLTTATVGIVLPPKHLKLIGAGAALALTLIDYSSMHAAGAALMAMRGRGRRGGGHPALARHQHDRAHRDARALGGHLFHRALRRPDGGGAAVRAMGPCRISAPMAASQRSPWPAPPASPRPISCPGDSPP